jgi:hypothetical protein
MTGCVLTGREGIVFHRCGRIMLMAVATEMLTLVGMGYNVQLYQQGSFGMSIFGLA